MHCDATAAVAADALAAEAFTSGRDMYFGAGRFQPETPSGQRLLAHELAHVVQQAAGIVPAGLDRGPGDSLERAADARAQTALAASSSPAGPLATLPVGGDGAVRVQRQFMSEWHARGAAMALGRDIGEAADSVGDTLGGAVRASGRFIADVGKYVWREARELGEAAVECAAVTGRGVADLFTGRARSLTSVLGIPEPQTGSPDTFDIIVSALRHPCLRALTGPLYPRTLVDGLESIRSFLAGAWRVLQDPQIILDAIQSALGEMVATVPGLVQAGLAQLGATFTGLGTHLEGIWRHLEPKLQYLGTHWWDVLKEAASDLIWPWPGVAKDLGKIWELIKSAGSHLWDLEFSAALDDLLTIWRTVNTMLGRLYGWFFIASVLVGTIIGAFFGGVGAIPGAAAGAKFALVVGEGLLISTVAAETATIVKSAVDLSLDSQTPDEDEEDYELIAGSSLTLAITGAMMALGALAARFGRAVFNRVSGLFRRRGQARAATPRERLDARNAARAEQARAQAVREGVEQTERAIREGTYRRELSPSDRAWLEEGLLTAEHQPGGPRITRNKELAYDPDLKGYRVNEARAAIAAEQQGVLPRPVRRATETAVDFVDGAGAKWNHKGTGPGETIADAVADTLARTRQYGAHGVGILADFTGLGKVGAAIARLRVIAQLPPGAQVRFVGPASLSGGAVSGGVAGGQVASQVEEGVGAQ